MCCVYFILYWFGWVASIWYGTVLGRCIMSYYDALHGLSGNVSWGMHE